MSYQSTLQLRHFSSFSVLLRRTREAAGAGDELHRKRDAPFRASVPMQAEVLLGRHLLPHRGRHGALPQRLQRASRVSH